jgi:hypothetical protein
MNLKPSNFRFRAFSFNGTQRKTRIASGRDLVISDGERVETRCLGAMQAIPQKVPMPSCRAVGISGPSDMSTLCLGARLMKEGIYHLPES